MLNENADRMLHESARLLNNLAFQLQSARHGFGGRTMDPTETMEVLRSLYNAVSHIQNALNAINRGER